MAKTIAKDTPLSEITLRKYEKPGKLPERELVRKICLSLGLLQPGDSRDVVVDVLHVLLGAKRRQQSLTTEEIEKQVVEERKKHKLQQIGIAKSNISRQLRRLKELLIVEKHGDAYRITEHENLDVLFEQKIEQYYLRSIVERVKEYLSSVK
jgi:DNA-binding transcriptional ArsR family regulator